MSDEKKQGDGHRKFILKGGPWNGITLRLYPVARKTPGVFDDFHIEQGVYEHPPRGQQDGKKPFLLYYPNT